MTAEFESMSDFITCNPRRMESAAFVTNDKADFAARFLAGDGTTELGSVLLTGPDAAGRGSVTGLFELNENGNLVSGIRLIEFVLTTTGNDGYADNLSFILTDTGGAVVPEPSAFLLVFLRCSVLLRWRRRTACGWQSLV